MRDETAVGIVTDRDLALRCLSEGQDPSACSVGDVMTRRIVTIRNDEGLADAVKAMRKAEVRRLIVVDESDRPVGLLSFGDLFGLLASELAALAAPASPREPKLGTTEKLGAAA